MAWDFTVSLPNHPGTLAAAAAALAENDINIDGSCMVLCEDVGELHILVEGDAAAAGQALEAAGVDVRGQREVLVVEAEDRPGELGRLVRRIADAGVNIELQYIATRTRIVIGADDLDKARAALG